MVKLICYLCSKTATKHKELSFHKFPKDSGLCLRWKQACGINALTDVFSFRICSTHFHEDIKLKVLGNKQKPITKLASGSVPSISVPFPPQLSCINQQKCASPVLTVSDNVQCSLDASINTDNIDMTNKEPLVDSNGNFSQSSQEKLVPVSTTSCDVDISYTTPDSESDESQEEYTNHDNPDENPVPPKKRRRFEPLYIKEVELTDFGTPRRGNRTLKLIKTQAEESAKKFRLLSKQNKYYKEKIQSLRETIKQLTSKDLIPRQ
ncbi:uncharacterized protein LOC122855119 [Aphidius gifuensis]|uniref:uncharacterized protein LOC122855119 n=1 Tax=Aphidius gifuensis TaxID=684658 RepID=UPI001CDBAF2A|nr:uncharacterized protein LOC122855119 [Aphidius gifuensis]